MDDKSLKYKMLLSAFRVLLVKKNHGRITGENAEAFPQGL